MIFLQKEFIGSINIKTELLIACLLQIVKKNTSRKIINVNGIFLALHDIIPVIIRSAIVVVYK